MNAVRVVMIPPLVAPLAGAWIEILLSIPASYISVASPPSRGRGLKFGGGVGLAGGVIVAPLAGAWIEIGGVERISPTPCSRPPRGGVD